MSFWVAYLVSLLLVPLLASYASARDSKSIRQTPHGIRRASFQETPSFSSSVHMCVYASVIGGLLAGFLGGGGSGSKETSLAFVEHGLRDLPHVYRAGPEAPLHEGRHRLVPAPVCAGYLG